MFEQDYSLLLELAHDNKVKLSVTPRHAIVAPSGRCIISCDYSSQELYIVAVLSQDPIMLKTFTAPKTIEVEGIEYPNPEADLHTLTTVKCCFPELFAGMLPHLWVNKSKDKNALGKGREPRFFGKVSNFAIIYLTTPETLSQTNHVPVEQTKKWIELHQRTYTGFWKWANEVSRITEARGWMPNAVHRSRWCQESNAKKAGESAARNGVNFLVQGLGADTAKVASPILSRRFEGTSVLILSIVHDELLIEAPGNAYLDIDATIKLTTKKGDGYLHPVYTGDEEANYWAGEVKQIMEEAESRLLNACHPELNINYPGKAEPTISRFWAH